MQNKSVSLAVGFVVTIVVLVVLVVFMGRASTPQAAETSTDSPAQVSLDQIKGKTDGLVNYGDLPKVVTKDDIERSNPFDSY